MGPLLVYPGLSSMHTDGFVVLYIENDIMMHRETFTLGSCFLAEAPSPPPSPSFRDRSDIHRPTF